MFHSRGLNSKINRLDESRLHIVYSDNRSSFQDLVHKHKSVSIHVKNLQILALEVLKAVKNVSAPIVRFFKNEIMFTTCEIHLNLFYQRFSVFHDIESISYLRPQIWNMVPLEMKPLTTINAFKREVK